jgi:hypothetical protein
MLDSSCQRRPHVTILVPTTATLTCGSVQSPRASLCCHQKMTKFSKLKWQPLVTFAKAHVVIRLGEWQSLKVKWKGFTYVCINESAIGSKIL